MKINYKSLARFVGYYLLIIFIVNLLFVIFLSRDLGIILTVFKNLPESLFISIPCTFFPVDMIHRNAGFNCPVDYGLILLYLYLALLSLGLVFSKKLKFPHWVIAFIFINFLILIILTLKDYMYWII
ncbi:MAG: hypothetical protein PHQ59_00105 [Candidatus Daviesbacteria bacterium]|nr:hypothetical protein [Candidatus Daviesbacteria bacterium]